MELRPYQQEAKDAIFEQWDSGVLKTLLVLPTGCGKTVVFAKVTEDCVRQGSRVLILAHRGELLDQAADKLKKTTGLGCAVEKAESSCQGTWFRVVVGSVQTLICENAEVAQKMTENLEKEAGMPVDIEEAEKKASEDVVAQREESLAKQLAEMKRRKKKLVDPLQFEMSIQAEMADDSLGASGRSSKGCRKVKDCMEN